jgi:hypothetical protein
LCAIVMTAALEPARALAYLATLSTDLRASAVLGADGAVLAGDADLGRRGAKLLGAAHADAAQEELPGGGMVLAARSATHIVAVEAGPHVLATVLALDLRNVLGDLAGAPA